MGGTQRALLRIRTGMSIDGRLCTRVSADEVIGRMALSRSRRVRWYRIRSISHTLMARA
jgi:hypothetical protein